LLLFPGILNWVIIQVSKIKKHIVLLTLLINGCIEPFTPDVDENQEYLVINGLITDQEGFHYADVSWSSSYDDRGIKPVNDCVVKIIDNDSNEFFMENYDNGKYRSWIEEEYLKAGNKYKLEVILENGKKYESAYDEILPCPGIDKVYYEIEEKRFDDPLLQPLLGIQIYLETDATGDFASHYRWSLTETWEYKAQYLIFAFFDGIEIKTVSIDAPLDSLNTCWTTARVRDIYLYTTFQKSNKKITALPLNYVSNQTERLKIKYSLLINQYSLSDAAFEYWDQLEKYSEETGGLYETQPSRISGNFSCLDNEDEIVLGFFSASSISAKRYFVEELFGFFPFIVVCEPTITDEEELWDYLYRVKPENLPVYLINSTLATDSAAGPFYLTDQECFDCRLKGGTLSMPDFW
jgi:hypothetical protein